MRRFFCSPREISEDKIVISDKSQVHHIKDVLRLKAGDEALVCDGLGNEYVCFIDKVADKLILNIKDRNLSPKKDEKIKITVACALPKNSKMDDIIDKLTQLGVDRIIPMLTERVVIKLDKHKKIARMSRWRKIALSASKQSQRRSLPVIEPVKKLKEILLEANSYDLKLIPSLVSERKTLKEVFNEQGRAGLNLPYPKNILVLIGPEGDFTPSEVNLAKDAGFIPVSLGDLVLRVETAAIAVASFIRLFYDK